MIRFRIGTYHVVSNTFVKFNIFTRIHEQRYKLLGHALVINISSSTVLEISVQDIDGTVWVSFE